MGFAANGDMPIAAPVFSVAQLAGDAAKLAATSIEIAAITLATKLENARIERIAAENRAFIKNCYNQHWNSVMGQQKATAETQYANYISCLCRSFCDIKNDALNVRLALDPAINASGSILNELYTKALLAERLANLATLDNEEDIDAAGDTARRKAAVNRINDADTALARAKEDGIILAYKQESQRIETEEAKKGYYGGDGFRDKQLLIAKLQQQDAIAENNEGTKLRNTTRLEELELQQAARDFDLSQDSRNKRFAIYEDDVLKRLNGGDAVKKKVDQDDNIRIDGPDDAANRALNRKFDNSIFKVGFGPPSVPLTPQTESSIANLAKSAGSLLSTTVATKSSPAGSQS